jgi:hypothetical protein
MTHLAALAAVLVTGAGVVAVPPQAHAAEPPTLITPNVVTIIKTVSDAGFVHPGVGLSAEDLRSAQTQVRAGQEPWASYFAAMSATSFASTTYRASNSKSAAAPDQPLDNRFNQVGLRYRETNDSFGALTQALMWTITGDEVYRRNAVQALRTWSRMDAGAYAYFADAHIHTGHPLYQFLMAAEIIRATEPLADDTPGTYNGYDVVWHSDDDQRLLTNFANPVVNTFLYSNTRWMNQHNFGLFGRIATAIYADDTAGYAKGVEWLTVNSSYDGYDNGAMAPQLPLVHAGDADNPYGYDFVQVREMGRDQAHGECNIDNFTGLARMLDVQGTKVDPVAGTVSTAADAVSAYNFLGQRLLDGANAFFGFMMGAPTPWVDERGAGWNGTISQAYRGRMFNAVNELYYQYKYQDGIDVEQRAPWVAELSSRMDGPYYYDGTNVANFWGPGDKNPEYWIAFPQAIAGTAPPAKSANSNLGFAQRSLQLDSRTEIVTEDGKTFARAHVDEQGTTSVVSRIMHDNNGQNGLLVRTDGPAKLEVLDKEKTSGLNKDEAEPKVLATMDIPDTGGNWRYVTYTEGGTFANFYRLTGQAGTTVDLDHVLLQAQTVLTPPQFKQGESIYYLTARHGSDLDLSATDSGGGVTYTASGLPTGASLDPRNGHLTWTPSKYDVGRHKVQVVADDGQTVATRTFELVVAKNYQKTIDAAVADGTDPDAVYTTVTREPFDAALAIAREAAETGSAEQFDPAFAALLGAIKALKLLNPTLADGTLNYLDGVVVPTGIDAGALKNLADNDDTSIGDLRVASFVLDFGTRYRITAQSFGLQARFTFGNRLQGTNVYGSIDGITWDLLTEREAVNSNDWQTIDVVAAHASTPYRYLKLQVDHPGVPTDPAYPGIWSFAGLRIHGTRSEVPGTVSTVSVSSPDAVAGRVAAGDTVKVGFTSPKPITGVSVAVGNQPAQVTSVDGLNWTATLKLGDLTGSGRLDVAIDHITAKGVKAATIHGSTDGTAVYGSDERNLIDLADFQVVETGKASQSALMLDGNAATFSDVAAVDGKYYLTWDIGQGSTFSLDRVDFLARQDNNGMLRLPDLVLQGSNDLQNWTTLTGPGFKTLSWQNLPTLDHGDFRYLRVANSTFIDIAELRVFGSLSQPVVFGGGQWEYHAVARVWR